MSGEVVEDFSSDVSLETAHCLGLAEALFATSLDVVLGLEVPPHADHHDAPQGRVCLPVSTAVEAVAQLFA